MSAEEGASPADGTGEEKGAAVRLPPPVVPVIALVFGLVVESLVLATGPWLGDVVRYAGGATVVGVGIGLLLTAAGLFRATGQDPKPWEPSPELIVRGIYRYTRNPMYVSFGLLQAGLGIVFGSLWPLALVPVTGWIIYQTAIRHEEAYLREKFGEPYEAYLRDVRRWI